MVIAHLLASPFFGGPEKQMLGLARHLPDRFRNVFLSFPERGLCQPFLEHARHHGFAAHALEHNYPHLWKAVNELTFRLKDMGARLLTCSGYKPDLLGWWAARRLGIPVVAIAHGWTGATWKVRLYEALDRRVLRHMDAVTCVSEAQAVKVRHAGVAEERITVIRNAVAEDTFAPADPGFRDSLRGLFSKPPRWIVGAAGRLSPEKGFDQLVCAAALVRQRDPDIAFVIFGDGPLRESLQRQMDSLHLRDFVLAGFRTDVAKFLPHLDVLAIPSHTEGLPVILLEAFAAGVPVVATSVGGIPEVIEEGRSGFLVPPGDPQALARRILDMIHAERSRAAMGHAGQARMRREFTFELQARQYAHLFDTLCEPSFSRSPTASATPTAASAP